MLHVVQQRQIQPQYQYDVTFSMTSLKKEYTKALSTLHEFTQKVIREKRAQVEEVDTATSTTTESAPKGTHKDSNNISFTFSLFTWVQHNLC